MKRIVFCCAFCVILLSFCAVPAMTAGPPSGFLVWSIDDQPDVTNAFLNLNPISETSGAVAIVYSPMTTVENPFVITSGPPIVPRSTPVFDNMSNSRDLNRAGPCTLTEKNTLQTDAIGRVYSYKLEGWVAHTGVQPVVGTMPADVNHLNIPYSVQDTGKIADPSNSEANTLSTVADRQTGHVVLRC